MKASMEISRRHALSPVETVQRGRRPAQGFFPPCLAWIYIFGPALAAAPWLAEVKARAQRVCVISGRKLREVTRLSRSKGPPLDKLLHFIRMRHGVAFAPHPFLSFNDPNDPGMAYETLKQARGAVS